MSLTFQEKLLNFYREKFIQVITEPKFLQSVSYLPAN
jgi:hypothetical protein